ncbi:MAG: SGNH/GDSL hydrolase family protein, partial [Specibacter sp.]
SAGLLAGFAVAPATASPAPVTYTVLGDSYSAGTGGGAESLPCLQSPNGYGNDYAAATGAVMANLACYGATTDQVQALQVPNIPATTTLITLTVGGNDIGTGAVATACTAAPQSSTCSAALAASLQQLTKLPAKIKALIKAIKAKVPKAKINFLGYPNLFEPATMTQLGLPASDVKAARTMNAAADLLNGVIAVSALTGGARYVPVAWAFAGHGIPSASQWIVGPGDATNPFVFHPTATGYLEGYARALKLFV